MKILNILKQGGIRVGVTIDDAGTTYPIPWRGLFARAIFDPLIESGYELVDASTGEFEFNGISIFKLETIEDWQPTEEEQLTFDMYDVDDSEVIPMTELIKHQKAKAKAILREERHDYKINTREEFEAYLQSLSEGVHEDDCMPINYFVAPEARYTIDELITTDAAREAMQILAKRRAMSIQRVMYLKAWLQQMFPQVTEMTASKMRELYNKWDIDGLNIIYTAVDEQRSVYDVLSQELPSGTGSQNEYARKFRSNVMALSGHDYRDIIYPETGVSESYKSRPLVYGDTTPDFLDKHKALQPGEYISCKLVVPHDAQIVKISPEGKRWVDITITENFYSIETICTREDNPELKTETARVKCPLMPALRIVSPMNASEYLPDEFVGATSEDIDVYCKVKALVNRILENRTEPCDDSSYKILIDCGYSPISAVQSIANANNMLNAFTVYGFDPYAPIDEQIDYETVQYRAPEDTSIDFDRDISQVGCVAHGFTDVDLRNYFRSPEGYNYIQDSISADGSLSLSQDLSMIGKNVVVATYEAEANPGSRNSVKGTIYGVNVYRETKMADIDSIINGAIDFGRISRGRVLDKIARDNKELFENIYCAIKVLGMPFEQIEKVIMNYINNGCVENTITLSNGEITIPLNIPIINNEAVAAAAERQETIQKCLVKSPTCFKVIDVATELAVYSCYKRAVGVYGIACDIYHGVCKNINTGACVMEPTSLQPVFEEMKEAYFQHSAGTNVLSSAEAFKLQMKASEISKYTILTAFERDGNIQGAIVNVPDDWYDIPNSHPDWWKAIQENTRTFVESTTMIADGMFDSTYPEYPMYHCVNAKIRPMEVEMVKSFVAHETALRCVYETRYVAKHYSEFAENNLICNKSYFQYNAAFESPAWDSYELGMRTGYHHLDKNDRVLSAAYDMFNGTTYAIIRDDQIFSSLRSSGSSELLNEDKLQRVKFIRETALYTYYTNAFKWFEEHPNQFMPVAIHPAEESYYNMYYDKDAHEVYDLEDNEPVLYDGMMAYALVGPTFVDDGSGMLNDLPISKPEQVTDSSRLLGTTATKRETVTLSKLSSFTLEELSYDYTLGRRFFNDPAKSNPIVYHGAVYLGETPVELKNVRNIDDTLWTVYFIDTPNLSEVILYDDVGNLWRVKYENR